MHTTSLPATLPDDTLLREAARLVRVDREATASLVRVLMEVDARRLYLREGCSSLFTWCVQVLGLEEGAAYNRIEVARLARRIPAALDALERGQVSLTAVRLLAPHLTATNHASVLANARGLGKRDVLRLVAELAPRPAVACTIRRLAPSTTQPSASSVEPPLDPPPMVTPEPPTSLPAREPAYWQSPEARPYASVPSTPESLASDTPRAEPAAVPPPAGAASSAPAAAGADASVPVAPMHATSVAAGAPPASIVPLSPTRFKLQMTIGAETYEKLQIAQDLLRHLVPNGDLAEVVDRALTVLVRQLERQRFAATATPRPPGKASASSRHIPAFVRRAVWQRDGGQCAFVGRQGRCRERAWLEFHHLTPYATGGAATVENIALRCRAHNAFEASLFFGPGAPPGAGAGPGPGSGRDGADSSRPSG